MIRAAISVSALSLVLCRTGWQGRGLARRAFVTICARPCRWCAPLAAQRDLLAQTAGRPTVIDTEVFDAADPAAIACDRLRPVRLDGLEGALCRETGNYWSAADDQESFWPTHDAFLQMCRDAGRRSVTLIEPTYRSQFGPRRWYVLDAPR